MTGRRPTTRRTRKACGDGALAREASPPVACPRLRGPYGRSAQPAKGDHGVWQTRPTTAGEASRHAIGGARLPLLPRAGPGCAGAANGRRLRGRAAVCRRGTVQAEATRLYSAGLGASQRALTGASVRGSRRRGCSKQSSWLKPLRRVLASTGAVYRHLGGKKFRLYCCSAAIGAWFQRKVYWW